MMPVRMLIRVVFPAPLWPRIDISSFGSIYKLNALIASTLFFEHVPWKVLLSPLIRIPSTGSLLLKFFNTLSLSLVTDSS